MKILISLLNFFLILLNIYVLIFFYWLHEYKVTGKLNKIYSYVFLDWKIKTAYNSIEWQNIIIEKGSNIVVKEKVFMITQDTIIGWTFSIEKNWRVVKTKFSQKSLIELYTSQPKLLNVNINYFWINIMNTEIILNKKSIKSIIQWQNWIEKAIELN